MHSAPGKTLVPAVFISLGVGWLLVCVVILVRQRRKDRQAQQHWAAQRRHWERQSRIHQRVSEFLAQAYEASLTPEQRHRREPR